MGNEGDFWRDVRADRQQKRADNRARSADALTEAGISFERRNNGAHLIVHAEVTADFWPGTGLWQIRGGRKGRGVFQLIRTVKSND